MLDKRVIFHSRFAFAALLLVVVTSSYVISTWSSALCSGETKPQTMLAEDVFLDVYTSDGGRGIGQESGAFGPAEEVILYAELMNSPVSTSDKIVNFLICGPINQYENISLYRWASTNASGIARTSFSYWPIENYREVFGIWTIQATIMFGEQIYADTVTFEIGWIVEILSVEPGTLLNERYWIPRTNFTMKTDIAFKMTVKNIDLTPKNVLLTIVCYDQDVVPIGQLPAQNLTIPEKTTEELYFNILRIPKWATEGEAKAYANAFTGYPQLGGIAYCPEISTDFILAKETGDTTPPIINDAFSEPGIVQPNQEVTISVNVTDSQSGVQEVILYYLASTNNAWTSIKMKQTVANIFEGNIAGFPEATNISYVIIVYDYAGNFAIDDNAGQYYVYTTIPEFLPWTLVLSALSISAVAAIICRQRTSKKT